MNIGGYYKIYKKEYGQCDYLNCYLNTPSLYIGSYVDSWHDENFTVKIEANTILDFTRSDCHWAFMFYIFGFGICLKRQWDY